ncbi:MAG: DUF3368 domain-containing protein [Anaerolineales bacterium]|nr:DUF3368 domain-containing protein [Anaerolineales bacterium]
MPLVISDSSTLIHLAGIGRLELLRIFYRDVVVPAAVWREVVVEGRARPGVEAVAAGQQAGWIHVAEVKDLSLLQLLRRDLHAGEAEVIALAVERGAALVLLDETEARQIAEVYGLAKTGVVGVLLRAKLEGQIEALRPELDALREQSGFWIAERLYKRVLKAADE